MNTAEIFMDTTTLLSFIGGMAFIVSAIAETLKSIKWLDSHVPTGLTVIVLSVILVPVAMAAIFTWQQQPITWYMVFASFIAAFIVALVAMNGWEHVTDLASRMLKKSGK